MGLWDIYNQVLLSLNENPSRFIEVKDGYDTICQQLQVDNLVFSVIREGVFDLGGYPRPTKVSEYAINHNGIKLIASLPEEYKERPYDYFLKQKQDAIDAEAHFKELINKASQSTIRTSFWTLLLFIATTVMAVATLVLAIYPFIYKSAVYTDLQQIRDRLERLEDRALSHSHPTNTADSLVKSQTHTAPLSGIDSAKKKSVSY
jgi:hypothetical protein